MPASAAALQRNLVDHLRATGALTDPAVAGAFFAVSRHTFLPDLPLHEVYADEAIPTKHAGGRAISSSSQPAIMAIMLEQLAVARGQRILEIGAGTGYNAALLGWLVGPAGRVVTVDFDQDIVEAAREHLAAEGVSNVEVVHADGAFGFPPGAPYDRIILTVGAWDIAPDWYQQLRPGGRLVLPLELGYGPQQSLALDKPWGAEGSLWFVSDSVRDCGFMRLRGALAGPEHAIDLGPDPGLTLTTLEPPPAAADDIYTWLHAERPPAGSGLYATGRDVLGGGLGLWLGLRAPHLCSLAEAEGLTGGPSLPCLFESSSRTFDCLSLGLIGASGLALLGRAPHAPRDGFDDDGRVPFELFVHVYGPGGPDLARELLRHLAAWHASGRPGTSGLRVRVLSGSAPYHAAPGEVVSRRRFTQLVVDWPRR